MVGSRGVADQGNNEFRRCGSRSGEVKGWGLGSLGLGWWGTRDGVKCDGYLACEDIVCIYLVCIDLFYENLVHVDLVVSSDLICVSQLSRSNFCKSRPHV